MIPVIITFAPLALATCAANKPIGPGPITRTVSPSLIDVFSITEWVQHANGSVKEAAFKLTVSGRT